MKGETKKEIKLGRTGDSTIGGGKGDLGQKGVGGSVVRDMEVVSKIKKKEEKEDLIESKIIENIINEEVKIYLEEMNTLIRKTDANGEYEGKIEEERNNRGIKRMDMLEEILIKIIDPKDMWMEIYKIEIEIQERIIKELKRKMREGYK